MRFFCMQHLEDHFHCDVCFHGVQAEVSTVLEKATHSLNISTCAMIIPCGAPSEVEVKSE